MTDHANELRHHARKIPHPQGETPGVMLRAADEIECLRIENEALRAKITEMEQQEPVAYLPLSSARILESGVIANAVVWNCRDKAASDMPLYALPGAQPAPSVPDGSAVQTSARKENDNVATYRNGT